MRFVRRAIARRATADDYGLLVPVATVFDRDAAEAVRALLRSCGIRATAGPAAPGRVQRALRRTEGLRILVFPEDAHRAREFLYRHTV
ncbi:hypothetical protein [Nocardia transvalensis]|uniref:hypothetical protein n=1 Tax=Nocardia transvalensis TaxID=37333 RepID=UPI0018956FD0|nr:hypothetical protein [Nocardia transvalensis]MBF6327082.1 hypothetical protein [Nocardia transvalensis]